MFVLKAAKFFLDMVCMYIHKCCTHECACVSPHPKVSMALDKNVYQAPSVWAGAVDGVSVTTK